MNEIFRELGADYIIEGGQTMNPSTDDMLSAIDEVNADHIFILPNNKNIILAANQAQSLKMTKILLLFRQRLFHREYRNYQLHAGSGRRYKY